MLVVSDGNNGGHGDGEGDGDGDGHDDDGDDHDHDGDGDGDDDDDNVDGHDNVDDDQTWLNSSCLYRFSVSQGSLQGRNCHQHTFCATNYDYLATDYNHHCSTSHQPSS